jgi:hypothetical protein
MLAALVAVTAQVELVLKIVVVKIFPVMTHPGLLVAKLTAPVPEPPDIPRVKFELTSLVPAGVFIESRP